MNERKTIEVIVETPKLSFIKYHDDGSIDYISPLPCPFNYGSVPDTVSGDGDRMDAIVLGGRIKGGTKVRTQAIGMVKFIDNGEIDWKYICSDKPITNGQHATIKYFFVFYGFAKRVLNKLRGKKLETSFDKIEIY